MARWLLPASILCFFALAAGAEAQVSGTVSSSTGQPLVGATVTIVELNQAATTDRGGAFRFDQLPSGHYTLSTRLLGFAPSASTVSVAGEPVRTSITLVAKATRIEPVNVTASRSPVADTRSPLPTSVLSGEQVHLEGGVSLAHSIARLPGVRNVSTGEEIGKPMIRGLFGPRVLVLTDGSRLEDYSWSDEDGPSLDARIAERIEVIRGPASVLYGSDALSGVVNVIPAELSYASGPVREHDGGFELYGGSNNTELGTALMASGARGRHAWRVIGTGRFSQNYRTPTGEMPNSSFWALNGEGGYGIRSENATTTLRAAHYGGEFHLLEASGPDPSDPNGGPVRQTMDDRVQLTNDYLTHGLRLETKAQFQRHSLAEVSDDCVPPPGQTSCTPVKDQKAFGLVLNTGIIDFMVHHGGPDWLTGTIGVSGMLQGSNSSGPIFLVPSASTKSAAAFAFEQLDFGRLSFVAGARGDTRSLSSDAQAEITHPADSRSWTQASGDVGIVLDIARGLSLVSNVGTGWRAPTLFDLYANGPNLAEGRYEIGDPALNTERSRTLDGGLRWAARGVRAEVSVFDNHVDDFIFTTPTPQTQNGLRVFRHIQSDARLSGGEAALEARLGEVLTLRASHDVVRGDDRSNDVPLPLMPPQRTIIGADADFVNRLGADKLRLGGDVEFNQKQTRLNPEDFATDGYTLVNLDLSYERLLRRRPTRFDLLVRNAFNTTYRDYLSRFKEFSPAPGVNVILKVSAGNF